jgi:ATP-dependent DNA helicase RecG
MNFISENQNIEFKQSWHNNYLNWICGFANARDGILFIGKDNDGQVVGLSGWSQLMEEIPNMVTNVLGIVADVNQLRTEDKAYVEVVVGAYPSPVSYKGQFHYRSGRTKQELNGFALDKFLLQKQGKRWAKHPTKSYNPDIANAFFRSGYIELWWRGIIKIMNECTKAGLPAPTIKYEMGDFFVVLKKDISYTMNVKQLGLNALRIREVLYAKTDGPITNKIYQNLNSVSKRTASTDLTNLTKHFNLLTKTGSHGAGISYTLTGQNWGN